ncbi:MAG TPA: AMP-binding protein, partial [Thermoanaerobaculia bacterium]
MRTPRAVALTTEPFGSGDELTYHELNRRANQLARHLRRLGVGPESPVGLAVERSAEMVVALLAVLKAGGAYVPLDPGYPADRLAYVIDDSGLTVLITQAELRYSLPEDGAREVRFVEIEAGDGSPGSYTDWSGESDADLPPTAGPESPAYVIYTSGSTGRPKGVVVRHAAVVNFLASMAREPGLSAADTLLAVTTLSFDIAGLELWLPLTVGGRVAL